MQAIQDASGLSGSTRSSYSLIVPTKDRSYHLGRRLPTWSRQGFDEVLVVDSSLDKSQRGANEELCRTFSARYVHVVANRSQARNLGARIAKGAWIVFSDDDLWGHALFNRNVMDLRVTEQDWLKAEKSQVITIFRRQFFLDIGGYQERLVLGEDEELTARAIRLGRGGSIGAVFDGIGYEPDERERKLDFKRRLSNYMEYSFTLWDYLDVAERPARTAFAWGLTVVGMGRRLAQGELQTVAYFLGAVAGLLFGFVTKPFRPGTGPARK